MSAAATADGSGVMFDAIADDYDRLNRILSFGVDRGWRKRTVEALELRPGARVLDLATGTADLAMAIARRHPTAHVIGLDPSLGMVARGRSKVDRLRSRSTNGHASEGHERVELQLGDAQQLPFADRSFDGITIAFGIRNVPDRARALREMARVTRPGGRIAILELSEPRGGLLAPLARFHIRTVVPRLGAWLASSPEYRYLQTSIAAFPAPGDFAGMLESAGLDVLRVRPLTFGVCHLYLATPRGQA